jgi:hypothetical protein
METWVETFLNMIPRNIVETFGNMKVDKIMEILNNMDVSKMFPLCFAKMFPHPLYGGGNMETLKHFEVSFYFCRCCLSGITGMVPARLPGPPILKMER